MSDELKPCKVCNEPNPFVYGVGDSPAPHDFTGNVVCKKCGYMAFTAEYWNTRTPPTPNEAPQGAPKDWLTVLGELADEIVTLRDLNDTSDARIAELEAKNIRLKNDCDILLVNLDEHQKATGEQLDFDDACVVEQIRTALKTPDTQEGE